MARPGKNAQNFNRCPPGFVIGRANGAGVGSAKYVRINDISAGPTGAFVAPGGGGGTSLTAIADGSILSNLSGGSAVPIEHTITATLDYVFGSTRGMFLVRGATVWGVLAVGSAGQVLVGGTDPSWSFTTSITGVGTIAAGVWQGTKIGLAYGGTNADLSATGPGFLKQATTGANITVAPVAISDIAGLVSYPGDWDDPFLGAWSAGGWGTGAWGGLYYGIIPPSTDGQFWRSRGEAITPEWATLASADLSDAATGVWTPAMTINGSATGITFSSQSGQYQRIGKLVFAQFDITLSSKGVSVGSVVLTGLPLTASAQTGNCTISYTASVTGTISWMNFVSGSTTTVAFGKSGAGGWTSLVDTDITNTSRIVGQAVYLLP